MVLRVTSVIEMAPGHWHSIDHDGNIFYVLVILFMVAMLFHTSI